jgi:transposase
MGVWPTIEGDNTADQEVELFLTHARRSVMRDWISQKNHRKRDDYRDGGSLAELGALGVGRKEPTGCVSMRNAQLLFRAFCAGWRREWQG